MTSLSGPVHTSQRNEEVATEDVESKHAASTKEPDAIDATKVNLGYDYGFGDSENPYYISELEYTAEEERKVVHILDKRLFMWILLTTFVLNMDRTNNSNAISDNLPGDLGFSLDVVNTSVALNAVCFSVTCLGGAIIAKIAGPARWISVLMFSWGLVTLSHALVTDSAGYLTVRCFIAITEGGVIPATLVYLGGFYKSTELASRLAWFWGVQSIASAVSGLMASGLLQMRGIAGLYGWKWLFIVDGIITVVVAVATWFYLPMNAASTKGGLRGWKPWLDDRQIRISVTRIIRDDLAKRKYDTKVTWTDIRDSLTDIGLWLHLIITMIVLTPTMPLNTYLPTVIASFNFNVFVSNALTAPPYTLLCITMVLCVWNSDRLRERGWHGTFGATWFLVGWILLRALPRSASRGVKYIGACVVQSWPMTHPLNIAWMDENMGTIGKKTVASGMIIAAANIYGTWASQIYQDSDAPDFKRGNTINIVFSGIAVLLFVLTKRYYVYLNARNARLWEAMSEEERKKEEFEAEKKGNRSVTFRFIT